MTEPPTHHSGPVIVRCSFVAAITGIWVLWAFMATDVCLNHAAFTADEPLTRLAAGNGDEYCLPVSPIRPESEHLDYMVSWTRGPVRQGAPRYRLRSPDGVAMHESIELGSCQLPRDHSFLPHCRGRIDLPRDQPAPIQVCFGHLDGAAVLDAQIGVIHGIEREVVATIAVLLLLVSLGFGRAFRAGVAVRRWRVFCVGVACLAIISLFGPVGSTGGIALYAYRGLQAVSSGPLPALAAAAVIAFSLTTFRSQRSSGLVLALATGLLAVALGACVLAVGAFW